MTPIRRRIAAAALALAVVPALAACGSEDSADNASDSPSAGSSDGGSTDTSTDTESSDAEASAFPVTIEHKFGSTTIEAEPTKVVSVGLTDQDALFALGVDPVAVTYWYGSMDNGGVNTWAEDALGDGAVPQLLDPTDGVPIEEIAALAPDLIIGQYAGITQDEYDLLSKIAPTVAQPGDYADYGVPWQEATLTIGKAVGKEAEAQELVDGLEGDIAAIAAEHPEFEGKSALTVTPYEGLFVYGPEDPRNRLLVDLGFTFPEAFAGEGSEFGTSVSTEQVSQLDDVDVSVWLGLTKDADVESVYESTSSFTEGRYVDIDDSDMSDYSIGHSFATVLSIPFVLESLVPQLAAAVDGDPATVVPPPAS